MTRSYLVCAVVVAAACEGSAHKDGAKPAADPLEAVPDRSLPGNPFAKSAPAVVQGKKLYMKNGCPGCHGVGGGGGMGKPLIDDVWRFGSDDATLLKLIRGQIPDQTMPKSFGATLTEDEVWKILTYVRSLYAGDPGTKIDWTPPPPVPPELLALADKPEGDPVAAGKQTFLTICITCHGPEGKGDGPASATLNPKPRNLTDATYMATVNDRYLFELISRGGVAVGRSPLMPSQPTLTAQDLNNVIAYVRSLSGTAAAGGSTEGTGRVSAGH
jgi:mono/diheme cytochrome c family protein